MPDESLATGGAEIGVTASSSPRQLMREAIWLALILIAFCVLDSLGRRGHLPFGGYLASLLLLILGLAHWTKFRIRLRSSRAPLGCVVSACVFFSMLLIILAIALAYFPRKAVGPRPSDLQLLHLVVLVPLSEELYFRGLLLDHLRRGFGALPALTLCSLLFALLHLPAGTSISACCLSAAACLLVFMGGTVAYAVQLHVAWNAVPQLTHFSDSESRLAFVACVIVVLSVLTVLARRVSSTGDSA